MPCAGRGLQGRAEPPGLGWAWAELAGSSPGHREQLLAGTAPGSRALGRQGEGAAAEMPWQGGLRQLWAIPALQHKPLISCTTQQSLCLKGHGVSGKRYLKGTALPWQLCVPTAPWYLGQGSGAGMPVQALQ